MINSPYLVYHSFYIFLCILGKVDVSYVHRLLEFARANSMKHTEFGMMRLYKDYLLFLVVSDTEIRPELHIQAPLKWMTWKFTLVTEILFFTKHSCVLGTEIVDRATGQTLVKNRVKFVVVSQVTRQPALMPEWALQSARAVHDPSVKQPLIYTKPSAIPSDHYSLRYTMMISDMDYYFHVNHVTYIRLAMDVASEASSKGSLRTLKGPVYDYAVRNVNTYFAKECVAGDDVMLTVWQDADDDLLLHCIIKLKETPLFYCDLELYKDQLSVLPPSKI